MKPALRALTCCFTIGYLATMPFGILAADWPQFHRSADHSGFNPDESLLAPSNVAGLVRIWTTRVSDPPVTAPVISDGKLYVGSNDSHLYALDAETGMVLWSAATGASIVFEPAVDSGRVFVASDDGILYAFLTSCVDSCAPIWTTAIGRPSSPPTLDSGVVYIGTNSALYAIEAATGGTLWIAPTFYTVNAPAVAEGVVYTGGTLSAFPTSCSTPCSPICLAPGGGGLPAIANGVVHVPDGYVNRIRAVSDSCALLWTTYTVSSARNAMAIANGIVYFAQGDGTVQAFPAVCTTGCRPLWTTDTGGSTFSRPSPAVANGVVYVGSGGALHALGALTGEILFSSVVGPGTRSPAVVDGKVFISTFGGDVVVFGLTHLPLLIDIKPGSFPNIINPRSRGVIPVALLGSAEFDVADVDVFTLRFGPDEAAPAHDLTDPWTYNEHAQDVNLDGFMDLVSHYRTQETGIQCGDTEATLTGNLIEGQLFAGTDSIRTVGCRSKEPRPVQYPQRVRRDNQGSLFDTLERD